jgi:Ca-activated chloride channel family protein
MLRHWFAQPWLLTALVVLPLLAALSIRAWRRRRLALMKLGPSVALATAAAVRRWPRRLRGFCATLALLLLGVGIAGPQWDREIEPAAAPGRDLVVVVDCSWSMTAEEPSRLALARLALLDLADTLSKNSGQRVALVVFAGKARVLCPLTRDLDHFRTVVNELETQPGDWQLAPDKKAASGTRIGAALQAAVGEHEPRYRGAQDILLLSDGDDPAHDGEWAEGIGAARSAGIPVHVVGIGNPDRDAKIVAGGEELTFDGQIVTTRLQEDPLRDIARRTGGTYIPAHRRIQPLGALYLDRITNLPRREDVEDAVPTYRTRQIWFLLPAFVLLVCVLLIPEGAPRPPRPAPATPARRPVEAGFRMTARLAGSLTATALVLLLLGAAFLPMDAETLLRDGDAAYERGDVAGAVELYARALERSNDPPRMAYNLAAARYRLAVEGPEENRFRELREAEQLFRACVDQPGERGVRARYGLANCLLLRAGTGDLDALHGALVEYQRCLADPHANDLLKVEARHNLARARLLSLQLEPPKSAEQRRDPPENGNKETKDPGQKENEPQPQQGSPGEQDQQRSQLAQEKRSSEEKGGQAQQTDERPPPGAGGPTIPDSADPMPLTARDAADLLDKANRDIRTQRERDRRDRSRPVPGTRDW